MGSWDAQSSDKRCLLMDFMGTSWGAMSDEIPWVAMAQDPGTLFVVRILSLLLLVSG